MNVNHAIGAVVTLSTLDYAVMGYAGYDPTLQSESIMTFLLVLMFAWWALVDAKKQKYHRPFDFGAFIFFAWPIVLPAYLVATRGWKGLWLFSIFIALFYIPSAMGWVAYYFGLPAQ